MTETRQVRRYRERITTKTEKHKVWLQTRRDFHRRRYGPLAIPADPDGSIWVVQPRSST